jgi:hypothetical protein
MDINNTKLFFIIRVWDNILNLVVNEEIGKGTERSL